MGYDESAMYDSNCLICAMPMLGHMGVFWRTNEHFCSFCSLVYMQDRDFSGLAAHLWVDFLPFKILKLLNGRIRSGWVFSECRRDGHADRERTKPAFHEHLP